MNVSKLFFMCCLMFGLTVPSVVRAQTDLNVLTVEVDQATIPGRTFLHIYGVNFGNTRPVVQFGGLSVRLNQYASDYILAEPFVSQPGAYRLTVTSGSDSTQRDEFEVIMGAQGPKGEKGDKGDPGVQGPKRLAQ